MNRTRRSTAAPRLAAALLAASFLFVPAIALGGAGQPEAPQAAREQYVPVKSLQPTQERLPATPLVIGAYAFVWVALLAFVWSVWRRQMRVERELRNLERRVAATERPGPSGQRSDRG